VNASYQRRNMVRRSSITANRSTSTVEVLRVVEIIPIRVVEIVPVLVVEMVPVFVVEMVPVFVVEMVPAFAKVGAEITKTNIVDNRMGLTVFIVLLLVIETSGVNGRLEGSPGKLPSGRPLTNN
jgi:hypothetical protein